MDCKREVERTTTRGKVDRQSTSSVHPLQFSQFSLSRCCQLPTYLHTNMYIQKYSIQFSRHISSTGSDRAMGSVAARLDVHPHLQCTKESAPRRQGSCLSWYLFLQSAGSERWLRVLGERSHDAEGGFMAPAWPVCFPVDRAPKKRKGVTPLSTGCRGDLARLWDNRVSPSP